MTDDVERSELLERIGLIVLGEVNAAGDVTPGAAWRSAINFAVKPTIEVDAAAEDALLRAERRWRGYCQQVALFADDGSFLISVSGKGAFDLPWVHVSGTEQTGFLTNLAQVSGRVDFVACSLGGDSIVAFSEEEHGYWIVDVTLPTKRAESEGAP